MIAERGLTARCVLPHRGHFIEGFSLSPVACRHLSRGPPECAGTQGGLLGGPDQAEIGPCSFDLSVGITAVSGATLLTSMCFCVLKQNLLSKQRRDSVNKTGPDPG